MQVRIALCDDNIEFLNSLSDRIDDISKTCSIKFNLDKYTNGNQLLRKMIELSYLYDLVILDIDMPSINGIELARQIRDNFISCKIIFISAYESQVFLTFPYKPDSFIRKSTIKDDFEREFFRVIYLIQEERSQISQFEIINETNGSKHTIFISENEIESFESVNRSIYISLSSSKRYLLKNQMMKTLNEKYKNKGFLCIHRTFIANLRYICSVGEDEVVMRSGYTAPLSRRKKKDFLNQLAHVIGEAGKHGIN